ncbi:hypothetical protein Tco_0777125 [Tanacetum coccineum]
MLAQQVCTPYFPKTVSASNLKPHGLLVNHITKCAVDDTKITNFLALKRFVFRLDDGIVFVYDLDVCKYRRYVLEFVELVAGKLEKKYTVVQKRHDDFTQEWIDEFCADGLGDGEGKKTFLRVLLSLEDEDLEYYTDKEIKSLSQKRVSEELADMTESGGFIAHEAKPLMAKHHTRLIVVPHLSQI